MDEFFHYGIKQRSGRYPYGSGERPYQSSDGYGPELFRKSKKANLDKFGKDQNHNILYIDGISGSGKSTLALFIKKPNDSVIHLDSYFETNNLREARKNRNKEFDQFLSKNNFDISILENGKLFRENIKEYFKSVDRFAKLSEEFGKEQYKKRRRVIMEGVQIGDETLYSDKSFYQDKPRISLTTSSEISKQRAEDRDMTHFIRSNNMDNELFHFGIKRRSGRYPYGSGERPYQDKERSRGRIQSRRAEKKTKEAMQKRAELLEQAQKAKAYEQLLNANKQRVLQSGSAKDLLQYKGRLTNQEYEQAFKRLEYEQKLMSMTPSEYAVNMKKIDNFMKNIKMMQQWADIGTDLYNTMARIYNTTDEGRQNPWRLVNKGNPQNQNKDKK